MDEGDCLRIGISTTIVLLCALTASLATGSAAHAQADSVASRGLDIAVFGAPTYVIVGNGGHNASITAGIDIGTRTYRGFRPYIEGRGRFAVDDGTIAWEKVALGGIKVERRFNRMHPYINLLIGRGELDCNQTTCYAAETNSNYQKQNSLVYSPGVGVDFDFSSRFSAKADFQLEHYTVKTTESGDLYSKAVTIGVIYHLGFGEHAPH